MNVIITLKIKWNKKVFTQSSNMYLKNRWLKMAPGSGPKWVEIVFYWSHVYALRNKPGLELTALMVPSRTKIQLKIRKVYDKLWRFPLCRTCQPWPERGQKIGRNCTVLTSILRALTWTRALTSRLDSTITNKKTIWEAEIFTLS